MKNTETNCCKDEAVLASTRKVSAEPTRELSALAGGSLRGVAWAGHGKRLFCTLDARLKPGVPGPRARAWRRHAYAWLKKPPLSSMRARSSADTSTLRGVSRKTLSATRCMLPFSA